MFKSFDSIYIKVILIETHVSLYASDIVYSISIDKLFLQYK